MAVSDSWRIDVREVDRSITVNPQANNVGAMVIKASKGLAKPNKIYRGSEQRIIDLFGYPSSSYPGVWEAIEYNKEADLWISAPPGPTAPLYGGVLVTKTGSIALGVGLSDPDEVDFTEISQEDIVETGDGSSTEFGITLSLLPYDDLSIDIEIDGTSLNVTPTDDATEVLSGDAPLDSGTLVRSTGALSLIFSTPPADGEIITATYTSDQSSNAYFALFSSSPRTDDEGVIITYDTDRSIFKVSLYMKNNKNEWKLKKKYEFSNVSGTIDGFGANIYIETMIDAVGEDDYIYPQVNTDLDYSAFTNDTSRVNFGGGAKGGTVTLTELTLGWAYFQNKATYPANIFIDVSSDIGIPTIFNTLRNTYQKREFYILPLLQADTAVTAITTKSGYSVNNSGLAFYWNWGKVQENYSKTKFWTPLTGRIGTKLAQMIDIFNGKAPSWMDEGGHGGQLGPGILELKYDPTESQLEDLDDAGINPVLFDPGYGVMIASQKTGQSPGTLSDTSWIGHRRLFDYIIRNIVDQVLIFQITKLNDVPHREQAKAKARLIVNPVVSSGLLTRATPVCDDTNNTSESLARREFVFDLVVQVTPFAERIIFNFINDAQGNIEVTTA